MAGEYQSSEELQRANRDAFIDAEAKKAAEQQQTEKQKLHRVLDKYIAKHKTVAAVRERLKENKKPVTGKALEIQFEVSDGIVDVLEKIKNELR